MQAMAAVWTEVGPAKAHDQARRDCGDRSRRLIAAWRGPMSESDESCHRPSGETARRDAQEFRHCSRRRHQHFILAGKHKPLPDHGEALDIERHQTALHCTHAYLVAVQTHGEGIHE